MILSPFFSSLFASPMATLLLVFSFISAAAVSASPASDGTVSYNPPDNYLIDCGSNAPTTYSDGRVFLSDQSAGKYFSSQGQDILISVPSANVPSPLYLSARVFEQEATYSFHISRPGWHWIRLHFYPFKTADYDLENAKFTLTTDSVVLLHEFNAGNNTSWFFKEYIINVTTERLSLNFQPSKGALAFINGIEVVSAPDLLITDTGSTLLPVAQYYGMGVQSYETVYRLNVGGPQIMSQNDSLARTWMPDSPYQAPQQMAKNVSVDPSAIKYPEDGGSPLIAPQSVYASAVEMANNNAKTINANFNVTWNLNIDLSYQYLVRLHFCDIVSQSLNDLYFNVFIGAKMAISGIDLSSLTGGLSTAYYKDFVVNSSMVSTPMSIQIGPWTQGVGSINALLNGVEVFKMNNSVNSLDGEFGVDGKSAKGGVNKVTVAAVGFAMMFGAFVGLGAVAVKWQKRPQDWQKRNSFSSWLLPLHAGDTSFMNSKNSLGSKKSQFFASTMGLGRYFTFAELSEATKNWDANAVIGVGGFGNVYIAKIDDGTQVAVKRGNPQSEQGINEFQTEIQMLSKLRHRHLVSLIGYCDENEEMILVNLAEWAMQWKRKGLLEKIMDPSLAGDISPDSMNKFAEAAEKCLAEYGVDRPTMGDVLWNLEYALQLQEAFLQGKAAENEEETNNKPYTASTAPAAAVVPPAEVPVIDDHSGTAMFAHFTAINGR
ncbi:hypothetical protein Vadar_009366 [Vaccinium darrowii]|uniref:Uncharacterized protein n=1 Tax=Vaccinium darrowii TaxID=229202 RepID=A0ACB7YCL4_9ERIC|nr:hypothetical protein Vadar_009366 [Vaccinium darrowii]